MNWKRMTAMALTAVLTLGMGSAAGYAADSSNVGVFPEEPVYEIDMMDQMKQYYTGFNRWENVSEDGRSCLTYCPEGARRDCKMIYIAVPSGVDTAEFLVSSGWTDVADQEKEILIAFEPVEQAWGEEEAELAYIQTVYGSSANGKYFRAGYDWRFVGYEDGGTLLQKYIMNRPINAASLVVVNGSDDISPEYLEEMKEKTYDDIYGTEFYSEVKVSEIPVPAWIIVSEVTENVQSVVEYWKAANECTEEAETLEEGSVEYHQNPESTSPYTYAEKVGTVRVTETGEEIPAQTIYDSFSSCFARTGTGSPYSSTLKATVEADKLFVHENLVVDDINREWFTYVPSTYQEDGEDEVPLVIYIHGGSQSGLLAMEWSDWYRTAEKDGFIVVAPSGALFEGKTTPAMDWNNETRLKRPWDDVKFVGEMLAKLQEEYRIDSSRIYITGHAMTGAPMVTTLELKMPGVFAAGAATGSVAFTSQDLMGPVAPEDLEGKDESVVFPMWTIFGEHDMEIYPDVQLQYYTSRYGLDYENPVESTSDNRYTPAITYSTQTWQTEDGTPLVQFTYVSKRAHSFRPEETELMYEEWLSHWSQDENGVSVYSAE